VLVSARPVELGGTVVGADCPDTVVVVSASVVLEVVDSLVGASVVDDVVSRATDDSTGPLVGGVTTVTGGEDVVVSPESGGATSELEPEHADRRTKPATRA